MTAATESRGSVRATGSDGNGPTRARDGMSWPRFGTLSSYLLLSVGGVVMLFPYLWMLSTSFKAGGTWFGIGLVPEHPTIGHYLDLLRAGLLGRWYLNTLIVTAVSTVSVTFLSAIAGYAFAKYRFPGREIMFVLILASMMIPTEMLVVPWYSGVATLGWIDSLPGVAAPGLITAFGVFVMRQFMAAVPDELLDAARIDGVSEFGLFWRICVPLARSALSIVAIFTFLGTWNDFLWPLIITNSPESQTLQVGLSQLAAQETGADWGVIMAGSALASLPMLIVFLVFQKHIVGGLKFSGLKG